MGTDNLPPTLQTAQAKARARRKLLAARRARGLHARALDDASLVDRLRVWLKDTVGDLARPVIAAYVPAADEPGAAAGTATPTGISGMVGESGKDFVDALASAVDGAQLLLPVCPPGKPQPLHWGYYEGTFHRGRFGLLEPVGRADASGPQTLSEADAIILPALAADPTTGMRLGRGAGYYDRSLAFARPDAAIAVAVYDSERHQGLAYDSHDVPANYVITPTEILQVGEKSGA